LKVEKMRHKEEYLAYRELRNLTPKGMCIVGACPEIYGGLRDVTPQDMCIIGACPSINEANREGRKIYLIIGKQINPIDTGLEKKVGEGEALIEVPRELIDDIGK
jgi:hypothetical protein